MTLVAAKKIPVGSGAIAAHAATAGGFADDPGSSLPRPANQTSILAASRSYEALFAEKAAYSPMTHRHELNVAREVEMLAEALGKPRRDCLAFGLAAAFHDVGKMSVPLEILHKPAKLEAGELEVMKIHTSAGAEILLQFDGVLGEIGAPMAHYHHERPDGLGYHGLADWEIPEAARICAIADVYEALTSRERLYRKRLAPGEAIALMARAAPPVLGAADSRRLGEARLGRAAFDHDMLQAFVARKIGDRDADFPGETRTAAREFLVSGDRARLVDIRAFELVLDRFQDEMTHDGLRAARASRILAAADRDPEKRRILERHDAEQLVRSLGRAPASKRGPDEIDRAPPKIDVQPASGRQPADTRSERR